MNHSDLLTNYQSVDFDLEADTWQTKEEPFWHGQNQVVKKIKPKIVPRIVVLDQIKDKCSSLAYFRTIKSIVHLIAKEFGWDKNVIVIKDYENRYDDIVKLILNHFTIRDHTSLTSKMATLAYPMKLVGYEGEFIQRRKQLLQLPIEIKPADKDITDWNEMKNTIIKQAFEDTLHPGGKIVCLTYAQGYPLRLHEIVNSTTDKSKRGCMNVLDMGSCEWHITSQHSKTRVKRKFKVTKEYVESIKPYLMGTNLICKANGNPYTVNSNVTLRQLGIRNFSVNGVRNSFETWNYGRSVGDSEKHRVSIDILAHQPSTAVAHYTRNQLANDMMKQVAKDSKCNWT